MTKPARSRDDVLITFATACPSPTIRDVQRWTKRHPNYASDIIGVARTLAEIEADDVTIAALDQLEDAPARPIAEAPPLKEMTFEEERDLVLTVEPYPPFPTGKGFYDIFRWYGCTWPSLAEFLGIDMKVVYLLNYDMLLEPISPRFVDALAFAFETDTETVRAGIAYDRNHKRDRGSYVSPYEPKVAKTYRMAIDDSDMTAERKAFWLDHTPFPRWTRRHRTKRDPDKEL